MNQFQRIIIVEIIYLIYAIIGLFVKFDSNLFILGLLILTIIFKFLIKTDRRDTRFQKDYLLIIIIILLLYYLITYFSGFFIGFLYSTYTRRPLGILKNVLTSILFIYLLETSRETIVKSGKYYKMNIIISIILFTLLELVNQFNIQSLTTKTLVLQFILSIFIPIIIKNGMLTLVCLYSNKKNAILYQILIIVPKYVLGVFPDLGDYVNATIQTILPLIVLFSILKISDTKREKVKDGRNIQRDKIIANTISVVCFILIVNIMYLVSGLGRFNIMAIGSGSMTGTINKGDAVIIDKKGKNFKKGEIIAFKIEGKVVVHRIIETKKENNETRYITKGDYNNENDGWLLNKNSIIGHCKHRIMFIGWPSVVLSELLK